MSDAVRAEAARGATTQIVLEAVRDLHAQQQIVTRETLAEQTGLKLQVIDDRVGVLVDRGQVARVQRGVFVPVTHHPEARVISKTILPDGTVKIDLGDDQVLTLTPRESRMLGELVAGAGQQFAAIELGNQAAILAAELAGRIRRLERELRALRSEQCQAQLELAAG